MSERDRDETTHRGTSGVEAGELVDPAAKTQPAEGGREEVTDGGTEPGVDEDDSRDREPGRLPPDPRTPGA